MNKPKSGTKTGRTGKVKLGRPPMNEARAIVVDAIGPISPEVAMQDSCLRAYLQLGSIRAVADSLGISVGLVHRHVVEGSAHLRDAGSPEHRAAVLWLVERRCNHLWATVEGTLGHCVNSGQIEKVASLAAVGAKLCELLARFHGVGGFDAPPAVVDVARVEEIQRRLLLADPHSKAARVMYKKAMKMADVTPEGGNHES
mgnify:FL=1